MFKEKEINKKENFVTWARRQTWYQVIAIDQIVTITIRES